MKKHMSATDRLSAILLTIGCIVVSSPLIILMLALIDFVIAILFFIIGGSSYDTLLFFVTVIDILIFGILVYCAYDESKDEI